MNAALRQIPRYVARIRKVKPVVKTFPRFRKPRNVTLTDLMRMTLNRASSGQRPFGLFVFTQSPQHISVETPDACFRVVLWGAHTRHYDEFNRRYPDALVGTYDHSLKALDLAEDLRDFLSVSGAE